MRFNLFIIFCFFCIIVSTSSAASTIMLSPVTAGKTLLTNKTGTGNGLFLLATITPKAFHQLTGRGLSLKEKIVLRLFQYKLKKAARHPEDAKVKDPGKTSFTLGLISLALLFIPIFSLAPFLIIASIPLAILAVTTGRKARRLDPTNKKAKTGIIFGIITLSLLAFVILLALLVASIISGFGFD